MTEEPFSIEWQGTTLTEGDACPQCRTGTLFAPPLGALGLRCTRCGLAPGGGGQGEMALGAKAREFIDKHGDEAYIMAVKLAGAAVAVNDDGGAEMFAQAARELMQAGYHKKVSHAQDQTSPPLLEGEDP